MRQDNQKFLAAIAPDRIGITDVVSQFTCQLPQYFIADRMTIGIIDLLEMIDIQHGDGKRSAITI